MTSILTRVCIPMSGDNPHVTSIAAAILLSQRQIFSSVSPWLIGELGGAERPELFEFLLLADSSKFARALTVSDKRLPLLPAYLKRYVTTLQLWMESTSPEILSRHLPDFLGVEKLTFGGLGEPTDVAALSKGLRVMKSLRIFSCDTDSESIPKQELINLASCATTVEELVLSINSGIEEEDPLPLNWAPVMQLRRLRKIELTWVVLTKDLIDVLAALPYLNDLSLEIERFVGDPAVVLESLKQRPMAHLSLGARLLAEPTHWTAFPVLPDVYSLSLDTIFFSNRDLVDSSFFVGMACLTTLELRDVLCSKQLFQHLARVDHLRSLSLNLFTDLNDEIMDVLTDFPALRKLEFGTANNYVHLTSFPFLPKLEELRFDSLSYMFENELLAPTLLLGLRALRVLFIWDCSPLTKAHLYRMCSGFPCLEEFICYSPVRLFLRPSDLVALRKRFSATTASIVPVSEHKAATAAVVDDDPPAAAAGRRRQRGE